MLRTAFRSHFSHCSGPRPLGASAVAFCAGISIVLFGAGLSWRRQQEKSSLPVREKMTKTQFDRMMANGLEQAKADDSYDFNKAFDELEAGLEG